MTGYSVYITQSALREIKDLPGHMRQRIKCAINNLADNPHPPDGKAMDLSEINLGSEVVCEVLRIRLDKWRIVYVITEAEKAIDVLAVRKRPPYDYGDLQQLLNDMK